MSNCRSLSISVNFTIGTFAFAMTCTYKGGGKEASYLHTQQYIII
jgi:hypothetical protein